jgi:uncharacterized protein (DUF2252 family)
MLARESDIVEQIRHFNGRREPERLALKYAAMRRGAFVFFARKLPPVLRPAAAGPVIDRGPPAWCCGDLHLENFGTYKGHNRLAYFDINDFDEAAAFLHPLDDGQRSYVLRALLPSEDRVMLDRTRVSMTDLAAVVRTMGAVAASAHLRSAGRDGSAIADALIEFGRRITWRSALLDMALDCAEQVQRDWTNYCEAYDAGAFASWHW